MTKTIGLRLSTEEIEIVNNVNKEGLSNSDVLRRALHFYHDNVNTNQQIEKTEVNKNVNEDMYNLLLNEKETRINEHKDTITFLKDQNSRFQELIEVEIKNLHEHIGRIYSNIELSRQLPEKKMRSLHVDSHSVGAMTTAPVKDFRKETDDILKNIELEVTKAKQEKPISKAEEKPKEETIKKGIWARIFG